MDGDLFAPRTAAGRGPRGNIFTGTCSWTDPALIKTRRFYPRGCSSAEARLRYYASVFPIVEVDSSYYAMPTADNAVRWAERTPPAFRFNVKAFRLFTGHQAAPNTLPPDLLPLLPPLAAGARNYYYADLPPPLQDELWRRFIEAIAPLRAAGKLTAVHFQFAPWVRPSPEWTRHVEDCVARMDGHLVAVEFRNQGWLPEDRAAARLAWLRDLRVVHVVVDEPQGVGNYAHGVWEVTHGDLAIVRLHGRNGEAWNKKGLTAASDRFDYEYAQDELFDLAGRTAHLADQAFAVQVLVNVNHEDQGIRAALRLQDLFGEMPVAATDAAVDAATLPSVPGN